MTTSILLALLLPACGGGGSVVLGDELEGEEIDEEVEEEEEEEEEEVLEPVDYIASVIGFNERWGGEFCTGEVELTIDNGVLTGEGSCESWGSATEISIEGEVDEEEIEGDGSVYLDFGWGDPIDESGDLEGEADENDISVVFEVEVDAGGGADTFEFTIEGQAE